MNYGKRATNKKRDALSSHSTMMGKKAHVSFIRILFISLIAFMVIGGCLGLGAFKGLLDNAPDISEVNIVPIGSATFVYDSDGNQLQKLTAPNSNRMPVTIDKIPKDLQNAVVAIEDERFYEHNGIDIKGIIRAGVKGITSGNFSEGASTITQQLLKNNVFQNWTNESQVERFKRKFQEWFLAVELEKQLKDKNVILENYLNTINLGNGNFGVQAAAHGYFNKDVSDLTLSECAVLAGITQNPTRYNPAINPEENAKRREDVLDHMLEQEYITQEQYDECMADNVYERIQAVSADSSQEDDTYSYFIDELTKQVINDLMTQKAYTEQQAYNALYSGGLRIYTTQDPDIQQICDEEYSNPENFPYGTQVGLDYALTVLHPDGTEENYSKEMMETYFQQTEDANFTLLFDSQEDAQAHIDAYKAAITSDGSEVIGETVYFVPQPQSSLVIMDQHTGYVKAIVGGRGEKTTSLSLNRATRTYRQPGSTFKIVSTYAPALNECGMSLATTYDDEPYEYANGKPVNNWLTGSYGGPTTIRDAIIHSVNVVAVKCFTDVTPELGYEYLKKFGFSQVVDSITINGDVYSDIQQPTALGGITIGVSNLELTAAYAAIANNGTYIKPMFYTKILDEDGNVILDNTPEKTKILKPSTAYLLTSAMEDVVKEGTGTRLQLDDMHVAGKTGTTEGYNDVWFAGFTPYYTCTAWAGYDDNTKLPAGDYRTYHQTLWNKIMSRIHENLVDTDFKKPANVEEATVCRDTGLLPNYGCPTVTDYFETESIPKKRCTQHSNYSWSSYSDDDNASDRADTQKPDTSNTPTEDQAPADADPADDTTDAPDDGTETPGDVSEPEDPVPIEPEEGTDTGEENPGET